MKNRLFNSYDLVGPLPEHDHELIVDSFAGAGGASLGIEAAVGRPVDIAINHDAYAMQVHKLNHPDTLHYVEDIFTVDPVRATEGRPVGVFWASPDCTHHSRAKGGKPRDNKRRGLAWVVLRWAAKARPRIIFLENVQEFAEWGPLRKDGLPDRRFKGKTFRQWVEQIRNLGYQVEWRNLNAADYGAPTSRTRLFLIARCDGEPITWPEPTHGPGRPQPYHTAAECIDWSLPCPSIFLTKDEARELGVRRPLAEATMRRIALGVKKYVLEAAEPFIVTCNHQDRTFRGQSCAEPLKTITASRDATGLVVPTLVQMGYGERQGQRPRVPGLDKPLGTVVAGGRKHALVSAFLAKHFTGVVGQDLRRPLGTITARDHHSLVTAHLTKFYSTNIGSDMGEPMPTVTSTGNHLGEVRAFLVKYYGAPDGQHQPVNDPLDTITAKARFGLVMVEGQPYQIVDIGLRMLTPEELLRAQFGSFADGYQLIGSKAARVSAIGNSVCPEVVVPLVRANYAGAHALEATG